MPRISLRITDEQENKLNKIAKDKNFIKPSEEVNISQAVRLCIDERVA